MNDMTPMEDLRPDRNHDGPLKVSRRGFLSGTAALVLSVTVPVGRARAQADAALRFQVIARETKSGIDFAVDATSQGDETTAGGRQILTLWRSNHHPTPLLLGHRRL